MGQATLLRMKNVTPKDTQAQMTVPRLMSVKPPFAASAARRVAVRAWRGEGTAGPSAGRQDTTAERQTAPVNAAGVGGVARRSPPGPRAGAGGSPGARPVT